MKRSITMNTYIKPAIAACILGLVTAPAFAVDYYLAAKAYTKTMPDGSPVPMWGYVLDPNGNCYNAASDAARLDCINTLSEAAFSPGPWLKAEQPAGTPVNEVRIFLSNGLPEPTSIVIAGLELPVSSAAGPSWNDNTTGSRASPTQRVRSYGKEAAANGGREQYAWTAGGGNPIANSGSFIYHSGTWPQKQVYMGLYGALTKDVTGSPGQVYPGVSYANQVMLFYSDIDPVINAAVSNGNAYTTSIDYKARWFLVNGKPYDPAQKATTEMSIPAGAAGSNTLVRFLSTASETHVPTLQGLYATIHGENGLQYNYQAGAASHAAPRQQYSVELPPLKTKDAIVSAPADGLYAVYDGNGYMTNPSDPNDPNVGDTVGGMLRFLSFSAGGGGGGNLVPSAVADSNTATEGGTAVNDNVLANDNLGDTPTTVTVATQGANNITIGTAFATAIGGSLTLSADGGYSYTPPAAGSLSANASDVFSYTITDNNADTSSATLSIAVNDVDLLPSAVADTNTATEGGVAVTGNVMTNDGVGDSPTTVTSATQGGNSITIGSAFPTASGGSLTLNLNGSYSYTPPASGSLSANVDEVFSYTITDGDGDPSIAALTISVSDVPASTVTLYFSTFGNANPPGVGGTADNADIYLWNGTAFSRVADVTAITNPLPGTANVDGLQVVDATHFYLSFAGDVTIPLPGPDLTVQDEDIVFYDAGTWSVYFDGTALGLTDGNEDIDAFSIVGGSIYFSTVGNTNPPGVGGTADNADVYLWNGAVFSRVFDATAAGLAGAANIDGLTVVDNTHFYLSFATDTAVPGLGTVQDEDVVLYNAGTWSVYFNGTDPDNNPATPGLTVDNQDLDAVHVVP